MVLPHKPVGLVGKKYPGRTASVDARLISVLRAVNLEFRKEDISPIWGPPIVDIAAEIQRRCRRFRKMTVALCKTEIAGAFNRIFAHPDLSRLMMAELDGRMLGLEDNVMVSHLLIPCGWISTPAYCQLLGTAMQALCESYGMGDIVWPVSGHVSAFIFLGDAIRVSNTSGPRLTGSIEAWEWGCNRIINGGSLNERKTELEGQWITEALILGFMIDTEETVYPPQNRRSMQLRTSYFQTNSRREIPNLDLRRRKS